MRQIRPCILDQQINGDNIGTDYAKNGVRKAAVIMPSVGR
jgi:hypothetical protein